MNVCITDTQADPSTPLSSLDPPSIRSDFVDCFWQHMTSLLLPDTLYFPALVVSILYSFPHLHMHLNRLFPTLCHHVLTSFSPSFIIVNNFLCPSLLYAPHVSSSLSASLPLFSVLTYFSRPFFFLHTAP
jgi:hypothetical protein